MQHLAKTHKMKGADVNKDSDECLWVIDSDDLRDRTIDATWPLSGWKEQV